MLDDPLQPDLDRLITAAFANPPKHAAALAQELLSNPDFWMGEEVECGIFVTDDSVRDAIIELTDRETDNAMATRPMRDRLVDYIYGEHAAELPAWQILQLTSSDGHVLYLAARLLGSSWEGVDRQLLGLATTTEEARAIVDRHCYADVTNLLARGLTGV